MNSNSKKKPQVLWVDDEISLLSSSRFAAERMGYDITGVETISDAYRKLKGDNKYDLVILDVMLPPNSDFEGTEKKGGLWSGFYFAKKAMAEGLVNSDNVILFTAYASPDLIEEANAAGLSVLSKSNFMGSKFLDVLEVNTPDEK